jgi:hypothetical protein
MAEKVTFDALKQAHEERKKKEEVKSLQDARDPKKIAREFHCGIRLPESKCGKKFDIPTFVAPTTARGDTRRELNCAARSAMAPVISNRDAPRAQYRSSLQKKRGNKNSHGIFITPFTAEVKLKNFHQLNLRFCRPRRVGT